MQNFRLNHLANATFKCQTAFLPARIYQITEISRPARRDRSEDLSQPQKKTPRLPQPKPERAHDRYAACQKRHSDQPDRDVAEENHDKGKKVTLAGDIRLLRAQNM